MVPTEWILGAWGRILTGYTPALSIEITRECPLRCPGCYAYNDEHLGGGVTLREVRDFKGQALIDGGNRFSGSATSIASGWQFKGRRKARAWPAIQFSTQMT